MVLTLEEVKLYLRVDGDEENTLITKFVLTAEELCEEILRFELTEFEVVPELVRQAILYAVVSPTVSNIWKGPLGAPVPSVQALSILSGSLIPLT